MDEELDASNYDWTTGPEDGDPLNYTDYTNNDSSGYFDSDNPYVNNSSSGYYGSNTLSSSEEDDLNAAAAKNPSLSSFVSKVFTTLGDAGKSFIKDYLYKDGKLNLAGIATAAVMLKAFSGGDKPKSTAYQGKIPNLVAVNKQIAYDDPNRVPGSAGREYFTNTQFVDPSKVAEAQTAADTQAKGILAAYKKAAAEPNPYAGKFAMSYEKPPAETGNVSSSPASGVKALLPVPQADDTIDEMAGGGMAKGRYLQGTTDGMADKIPSSIDGKQKAALSHGEFVIPADVVSHLGNGNSDAGAKKLYEMMSRVRKARTGNPEQGKRIDPNKFVPGGQVGYASGGIARFNTGGTTASTGTTGTGTGTTNPTVPSQGESVASGLSSWAGDYVTDYLGKGKAIANQPYQAYTGKLTAGPSDLQQQQFAGLSDVAKTGYTPYTAKGGIFDTSAAQQYMNPYLSAALDPQLKELRRQGQITNLGNQAQATKMGAFGSSGSALMQTEGQRNVMDKMQQALGEGYNTAYDKAMAQYNADQNRQLEAGRDTEASRQYSANFGLKTLGDLGLAGQTQRDIEQQGLTADKTQFEEARDYPSKAVQFQKSLLAGLPITTTDTTPMQSDIAKISNQITGLMTLYNQLATLGQTKS
jgi:predicted HicB family RNase H-like nuclease